MDMGHYGVPLDLPCAIQSMIEFELEMLFLSFPTR